MAVTIPSSAGAKGASSCSGVEACRISSSSDSSFTGFGRKKYTPISIAWATVRRLQKDDTTMHRGCSPLNWFICRSRPKPSRPGSTTSVTSSCGRSRFTMSKATSPLSVLPTTRNSPAASICWRSMVRNSSLASANTTVTLFSILSRSFSTQIAQPRLPVSRQSNICRLACI